jgi:hypothetical protein
VSVIGSALPFFFGSSKSSGPAIGDAYQGGFFAGYISHTANGVATHLLIVAPRATGATGIGYTLTSYKKLKTSNTTTAGTTSTFNGSANSANMNDATHPAAEFCETLSIDGYTDWYLPALYELDIAYQNLKPTASSNDTSWGLNPYSVPARASTRTAGDPARTTVTAFRAGNTQPFIADLHWTSTQLSSTSGGLIDFDAGIQYDFSKTSDAAVRAFRKVAL